MRFVYLLPILLSLSYAFLPRFKGMKPFPSPSNTQALSFSLASTNDPQMCGTYENCMVVENMGFQYMKYTFYGKKKDIPTSFEFISHVWYGNTTSCNLNKVYLAERHTGKVKKGTGENEFLLTLEHLYYKLGADALSDSGCSSYHQGNEEFDLMTSQCPAMTYFKEMYQIGADYSNTIDFQSTTLEQESYIFTLTDSSVCEPDPTTAPTAAPILPKDNSMSIVVVIIVVIIVVLIVVLVLLLIPKKPNRTMKVSNQQTKPQKTEVPLQQVVVQPSLVMQPGQVVQPGQIAQPYPVAQPAQPVQPYPVNTPVQSGPMNPPPQVIITQPEGMPPVPQPPVPQGNNLSFPQPIM